MGPYKVKRLIEYLLNAINKILSGKIRINSKQICLFVLKTRIETDKNII